MEQASIGFGIGFGLLLICYAAIEIRDACKRYKASIPVVIHSVEPRIIRNHWRMNMILPK